MQIDTAPLTKEKYGPSWNIVTIGLFCRCDDNDEVGAFES